MSDTDSHLSSFQSTGHLVLVRVRDAEGGLRAVIANTPALAAPLRVLHGVADGNGMIDAQAGKRGLEALRPLGLDKGNPAAEVLTHCSAGKNHQITAVTTPVDGLMERISQRAGSAADTEAFFDLLNAGDVRAAEKVDGNWRPQPYVIDGILNYFGAHKNVRMGEDGWDKVPLKLRGMTDADFEASGVRFVPGSKVRDGCYIGAGTVVMTFGYVNVGAYIAGEGVMVDVAARIASCAQIGKGVKFGGGSGIEGILEPAGRLPSIVEDHAKIGAMCEVSGIVGEGSVLASGVVMASGKKIYDEERKEVVPPLAMQVGDTVYQIPVIPPYRLAVGGALISSDGGTATDAILLKPGDLRDTATLKHFEKQGILYQ